MKNLLDKLGMRHRHAWVLMAVVLSGLQLQAQRPTAFTLDELMAYADAHSAVSKTAAAQSELANLQKVAAVANTVNLRGTASVSATDNFNLPVNFLPAEIFGGPAGTFRAVTFGQQFVNVMAISPQLDLVNPSTWPRVSSAATSKELTEVSNVLSRRTLHENIATAYYNYLSAESQHSFALQNLAFADTIETLVYQRYVEGVARFQDWNNAKANQVNLADFVQQLEYKMAQARLKLQTLIGMPQEESLQILPQESASNIESHPPALSRLQGEQAMLQAKLQRSELMANRLAFLPTVSVVAGFNWQQNSNESVFNSADWIKSQYIGLKISMPFPTETRLWSQAEEYRIQLKIKESNAAQIALQEGIQNRELDLDITRAIQALSTAENIAQLKADNLGSSRSNYQEGIISLDQYLTAFTELLNARLAEFNAKWNLQLQMTRLELNTLE